jgi:hypothetical protein
VCCAPLWLRCEPALVFSAEPWELKRTLQSLSLGKVRLLLKEPKTREVDDSDVFAFNEGLQSTQMRIKVNTIQLKETVCVLLGCCALGARQGTAISDCCLVRGSPCNRPRRTR